jgi:hypothetical protein
MTLVEALFLCRNKCQNDTRFIYCVQNEFLVGQKDFAARLLDYTRFPFDDC